MTLLKTDTRAKARDIQRFWKKVKIPNDLDACWIWTGIIHDPKHKKKDGSPAKTTKYGLFYSRDLEKMVYAHRYSWGLHFGILKRRIKVLHSCDNGLCVNPFHLFTGTHHANMKDMVEKGRSFRKISDEDVVRLRKCFARLAPKYQRVTDLYKKLARPLNVHPTTVSQIVKGLRRQHLLTPKMPNGTHKEKE